MGLWSEESLICSIMSSQKQQVTLHDLVEEAKKRIVILVICVVGLSYLMSLTSSSVWLNLPAAASLIVVLRYLSLDFEMRRKAATYNSKPANTPTQSKLPELPKPVDRSEWRRKVNSPMVEEAIDHFTRHLVSEWVTDLWYSKLTPDKEGPDELMYIINGILGEISARMRNINLIDLLTRDFIHLICNHLELFRATQAKIEHSTLTMEHQDIELRRALAAENKLHPALFSSEAEHKVLQHLMDGLISYTFKRQDLCCSFFRYIARELIACTVMRPIVNLACPRFINERIESLVINMKQSSKAVNMGHETADYKSDGPAKVSSDHFSRFIDPSIIGVELVQLKCDQSRGVSDTPAVNNVVNGNNSRDLLLSVDTQSSHLQSSFSSNSGPTHEGGIKRNHSVGEWGEMLDMISHRKTHTLAPEHFENVWTKGRNYRKKDGDNRSGEQVTHDSSHGKTFIENDIKEISKSEEKEILRKVKAADSNLNKSRTANQFKNASSSHLVVHKIQNRSFSNSYQDDGEEKIMLLEEADLGSSTSCTSEDEENVTITGLDSPVTKVWNGRSNRNVTISHIHHPLENFGCHVAKRSHKRLPKTGKKISKPGNQKLHVWQEVERTSFLSGDGNSILGSPKGNAENVDSSNDSETENLHRINNGAAVSSSAPSKAVPESHSAINSLKNSLALDSFYKLKCEVLGANIVKSDSKTFAVYSISVTDINNHSWSIKRRFRHFEELHWRLKEFPEYNLHLPPKHFLSCGLDVPVIRERCKLLNNYVKTVMQFPTISGSIEVWDFLSVDSQTYIFSNSFSIVETLPVGLDDKPSEQSKRASNSSGTHMGDNFSPRKEPLGTGSLEPSLQMMNNNALDGFILKSKTNPTPLKSKEIQKSLVNSGDGPESRAQNGAFSVGNLRKAGKEIKNHEEDNLSNFLRDAATDPTIPTEWVPPNLSVPIFNLVDVVFQLQDGGWIRRKAFWVAKQILQLGMGDAFDDWLIEKIQLLRKGSMIASGIKRFEQILWPDGIFITKHPSRQQSASTNTSQGSPCSQQHAEGPSAKIGDEQQLREAKQRAKFVHELMIENAPPAIVSIFGRKEYERCAKDLYFFIQSSVCLKQLAFDVVELLLVSLFPELDSVFKELHSEKDKFGEFEVQ